MKAINVLRGFLSESPSTVYPDEVLGFVNAIESELEEGYVELPNDADGEHIHIGDKLVGKYLEGNPVVECTRLTLMDDWTVGHGRGAGTPNLFVHHKPLTVEDVLTKMVEQAVGYSDAHTTVALNSIAEYATKLQLREED